MRVIRDNYLRTREHAVEGCVIGDNSSFTLGLNTVTNSFQIIYSRLTRNLTIGIWGLSGGFKGAVEANSSNNISRPWVYWSHLPRKCF